MSDGFTDRPTGSPHGESRTRPSPRSVGGTLPGRRPTWGRWLAAALMALGAAAACAVAIPPRDGWYHPFKACGPVVAAWILAATVAAGSLFFIHDWVAEDARIRGERYED